MPPPNIIFSRASVLIIEMMDAVNALVALSTRVFASAGCKGYLFV